MGTGGPAARPRVAHRLRAEAEIARERLRGRMTDQQTLHRVPTSTPPVMAQAQTVMRASTIKRKRDRIASARLVAMIASGSSVRAKRRRLSSRRKDNASLDQ